MARRQLLTLIFATSTALCAGNDMIDAAAKADIPLLKSRLSSGGNINELDRFGWTPLMWATFNHWDNTVRWLLSHGANPNVRSTRINRGFYVDTTALLIAARESNSMLMDILLAGGADPKIADDLGKSPLQWALQLKCDACAASLRGGAATPREHTFAHRVVQGRLEDLFVVIHSDIPSSSYFLQDLRREMTSQLGSGKVRHAILLANPLNAETEKGIQAARTEFKPKYILDWHETSADVSNKVDRNKSTFRIELRRSGETEPIWERDLSEGDSHYPLGFSGDAPKQCVQSVIEQLEADLLM